MTSLKVIISGGGTGGHVFPAIAIANALKKKDPATDILFVGAEGKIEMEKVPAAGYQIIGLDIRGLQRNLSYENLKFPFRLLKSLWKAAKIVKSFRPDIAVGVGGYASGPLLYAASNRRIPTLIQEQNSYPGITNKLLAKRASKVCVAYENMDAFFDAEKIIMTGNPVRENIISGNISKQEALAFFGLEEGRKTLLVIGGSLGARTLNQSMQKDLHLLDGANIQVIWQTGRLYYSTIVENTEQKLHTGVKIFEFISSMDMAYTAADVIVSRAGAGTISELCLVNKPVILVPSPNVAEDHQTKNAMALVKQRAALLVKDTEARDKLVPEAIRLLNDEAAMQSLRTEISKLGIKDSADRIAEEIFKLVKKSH